MENLLPSDLMPLIMSYWDPKDRAKMAMVNKAWNRCIYRNEIWGTDRWNPNPGTIGIFLHLPHDARHIGSPYKACFFHWLDNQRIILVKPVREYYHYWKQKGCPCLYIHHHRFEDTLIASKRYKKSSVKDQIYLFHRIAHREIESKTDRYHAFLYILLQEFRQIRMNLPLPQVPASEIDSYPYTEFLKESSGLRYVNQVELHSFVQTYIERLKGCLRALERRGPTQWILNEIAFAKDPIAMWESVAFHWN